jgi:NAD(P)-dependent dehydrogenase (short-subunit alcohol dehydrogenase family)
VTDLATIQAAKETIDQEDGKLDVLVNNAGTVFSSLVNDLKADFKNIYQVSVNWKRTRMQPLFLFQPFAMQWKRTFSVSSKLPSLSFLLCAKGRILSS